MRTLPLLLFSLMLLGQTKAQQVEWLSHYGASGQGFDYGLALAPDGQGNLYGTRSCGGNALDMDGVILDCTNGDMFIGKWDSTGHVVWAKDVGLTVPSPPVADLNEGKVIVYDAGTDEVTIAGIYNVTMEFDHDTLFGSPSPWTTRNMFVARYAADGECLWARRSFGNTVSVWDVVVDDVSNTFVFGLAQLGSITIEGQPNIVLPPGGFFAKYSPTGNLLMAESISSNGGVTAGERSTNGDWTLSGQFGQTGNLLGTNIAVPATGSVGFVARTNMFNSTQWVATLTSSGSASIHDHVLLPSGMIIAVGAFRDSLFTPLDTLISAPGIYNAYLASFDLSGNLLWLTHLSSMDHATTNGRLEVDVEGNVYVLGVFKNELSISGITLHASTSNQGFIAKFDSLGVCRSAWDFGKVPTFSGSVIPAADGIYLSCVYDSTLNFLETTLPGPTGFERYLMIAKLDTLKGFTGITPKSALNETLHIYANPNKGTCTIDLPQSLVFTKDLALLVYDPTGKLVQRIDAAQLDGKVPLDISALAKGMYHVELTDGEQRYSGTIVFE